MLTAQQWSQAVDVWTQRWAGLSGLSARYRADGSRQQRQKETKWASLGERFVGVDGPDGD